MIDINGATFPRYARMRAKKRQSMLQSLTRQAILDTLKKFDNRGREKFLRDHQATRRGANSVFICRNEREYDLKAIVYVALLPSSKGKKLPVSSTVAGAVTKLGFTVINTNDISSAQTQSITKESREGKAVWTKQKKLERSRELIFAAIGRNKNRNDGWIKCEACGLKDKDRSMFDVHHLEPVSAGERVTNVNQLAVLCPTCHRWAHSKADDRLFPLPIRDIARARRTSWKQHC